MAMGQGAPKDWKDLIAPRYNKDGDRVSMNSFMKEIIHIIHSPVRYVQSSMTGEWGKIVDVFKNKDFYNTEIHHPDDPWLQQRWDDLKHLFPTPLSVQQLNRTQQLNAPPLIKAMTAAGVAQPSPAYISQTPALQKAHEINAAKASAEPRTTMQFKRSQLKTKLLKGYERNADQTPINEAIQAGKITAKDKLQIIKDSRVSPLVRSADRMDFNELIEVNKKATPEEKRELEPLIRKAYRSAIYSTGKLREEKEAIKEKYNKYQGEK
jgi:hypothetical protein